MSLAEGLSPDWADLSALHRKAFAGLGRGWSSNELAALASTPGVRLDVASTHGFVMWRMAADEAEILTLVVGPEARRRGVGRSLILGAEREARASGATRMLLEVACRNEPARALYGVSGYIECGRRTAYFGPSPAGDALVLAKFLYPERSASRDRFCAD